MSTSEQLYTAAQKYLGDNFIGVFPLNKTPPISELQPGSSFIVNTHTHNLPGEHWLAVKVGIETIQVYDPLGWYYPARLVSHLAKGSGKRVTYNRDVDQIEDNLCGNYCLIWLMGINGSELVQRIKNL